MNPFTGMAVKNMLAPISINTTAATVTGVDTAGYGYAMIILQHGVTGAGDFQFLEVQHSDTDSNYADLSVTYERQLATVNTDVTTAGTFEWTVTGTATDDGTIRVAYINLAKCKRYLSLNIDPAAVDCLVSAVCVLSHGNQAPNTAAERGIREAIQL
jgi:hypothetical protein